jgi:hypothetical protein
MKVLYIGHYKEKSGWAQAAKDYILALDSIGVDVVCRNVTLTQDNPQVDKRLLKLEQKSSTGCDYCIQHVLPHHLVGTSEFKKNIAILESETTTIKHLAWFDHLQLMDEIWVPNEDAKYYLEQDEISVPVKLVPHCADIERYTKKYPSINIPQADGKFRFYYIGDLNDRKNISAIIRAFHSEFDRSEPVAMIFKIKKFGMSSEQVKEIFDKILSEEKAKLRMYPKLDDYIKDIVIAEDIIDEQICSLHQYCDCFVCPSHGEAWSIPSFDAMAFGKTPICSAFGGPMQFIDMNNSNTGELLAGVFAPCQCSDAAFPDMFTGRESWYIPCEDDLKSSMRQYYNRRDDNNKAKIDGLTKAKEFSYEKIGNLIKGILSE